MAKTTSYVLWCWLEDHSDQQGSTGDHDLRFRIELPPSATVLDLAITLEEKIHARFPDILLPEKETSLLLRKVVIPLNIEPNDDLAKRLEDASRNPAHVVHLFFEASLNYYWMVPPAKGVMHVVAIIKQLSKLPVPIYPDFFIWQRTVSSLYQLLQQEVRGTPGSGKSTLASLLFSHIQDLEPDTQIVYLPAWPEKNAIVMM